MTSSVFKDSSEWMIDKHNIRSSNKRECVITRGVMAARTIGS